MANIPGITGSILPDIFGAEIKLESDLGRLTFADGSLVFKYLYIREPDEIHLSSAGVWAYVDFSTGKYSSYAMDNLIQTYPQHKINLLKIALRNRLSDIWHKQDDKIKAMVMAQILGRYE